MVACQREPAHTHHAPGGDSSWEEEIRHHLSDGYLVLGVGSRLRGDDAAGSIIAEKLNERGVSRAFDCGGVPENFVVQMERYLPCDILFVDAVDFGAEPGTVGFFGGEKSLPQSVSTHSAGLSPLMDFLSAGGATTCWVLAIQPADVGYGADLSEPVSRAVEEIVASPVWGAASP